MMTIEACSCRSFHIDFSACRFPPTRRLTSGTTQKRRLFASTKELVDINSFDIIRESMDEDEEEADLKLILDRSNSKNQPVRFGS